jgi:BolA-like protein 1
MTRQDILNWRYKGLFNLSRVHVVSGAFKSKMQPARHRMVYAILREELDREGGIHALQLRTKTPEEAEKQQIREEG